MPLKEYNLEGISCQDLYHLDFGLGESLPAFTRCRKRDTVAVSNFAVEAAVYYDERP